MADDHYLYMMEKSLNHLRIRTEECFKKPTVLHAEDLPCNTSYVLYQNTDPESVDELVDLFISLATDATVANRQIQIAKYCVHKDSTELLFNYIGAAVTASSYARYNCAPEGKTYQNAGATQSVCVGLGDKRLYFKDYIYVTVTSGVVGDLMEYTLRVFKKYAFLG